MDNYGENHMWGCPAVWGLECRCSDILAGADAETIYNEAKVKQLHSFGYTVIVNGKKVPPEFTRGKIDKQDNGRKGGEEA